MSSQFGWLYLQLTGIAVGAALLCIAYSREEGFDARFWLWVAVVAIMFFIAAEAEGSSVCPGTNTSP